MPDKKKAVGVILAKMGGGPETEIKPEAATPDREPFHAAAEDIIQAIESKSVGDLANALESFYEICESREDGSD